jgi:hypothetical protein
MARSSPQIVGRSASTPRVGASITATSASRSSTASGQKQRWADAFGPKWVAGIVSALVVSALIAVATGPLAGSAGNTARPLRATIVPIAPVEPEPFELAFFHDIGLPRESERWQDLVKRGGVVVGDALFRVTLANRSKTPLTIREIYGEVVRSEPAPRASSAFFPSQGGGRLSEFGTAIRRTVPGSRFELHKVVDDVDSASPYFERNYISLKPGEVYEAKISVRPEFSTPTMVTYRFIISGSTAERSFVVKDGATARVSGLVISDLMDTPRATSKGGSRTR